MADVEPLARGTKRRARDNAHSKVALNIDLNFPPLDLISIEGNSSTMLPPPYQGPIAPGNGNAHHQDSSHLRIQGSLIDLEEIEDEVLMLPSSTGFPQRRNRARRNQPIMVVIDEDLETRTSVVLGDGEGPVTTLSLNTYSNLDRSCTDKPVINCDLYPDTIEANLKGKTIVPPEPVKEPTFTCPVCMNALEEASSTICGHIFCKGCIKASIKAQKKCPTCRRKLTMSNFHRVYLPSAC